MRVYLPATLPALARTLAAGELGPAPLPAHAVTPALRACYPEADLEELEYAAATAAARASLRLLSADPSAPRRRLVLAADVPDGAVSGPTGAPAPSDDEACSAVSLDRPVAVGWLASAHVDGPEVHEDVAAAVSALAKADTGDEDARAVVEAAEDHALMWYAAQELAALAATG